MAILYVDGGHNASSHPCTQSTKHKKSRPGRLSPEPGYLVYVFLLPRYGEGDSVGDHTPNPQSRTVIVRRRGRDRSFGIIHALNCVEETYAVILCISPTHTMDVGVKFSAYSVIIEAGRADLGT